MKIVSGIRILGVAALGLLFLTVGAPAFATVTVSSPTNNTAMSSTTIQYVANGSSPTCSAGVSAMGIYVDDALVYQTNGSNLN